MKHKVCPLCNSSLDFGEKCDCQNTKEEEKYETQDSKHFEVSESSDSIALDNERDTVLVMLRQLRQSLQEQ